MKPMLFFSMLICFVQLAGAQSHVYVPQKDGSVRYVASDSGVVITGLPLGLRQSQYDSAMSLGLIQITEERIRDQPFPHLWVGKKETRTVLYERNGTSTEFYPYYGSWRYDSTVSFLSNRFLFMRVMVPAYIIAIFLAIFVVFRSTPSPPRIRAWVVAIIFSGIFLFLEWYLMLGFVGVVSDNPINMIGRALITTGLSGAVFLGFYRFLHKQPTTA